MKLVALFFYRGVCNYNVMFTSFQILNAYVVVNVYVVCLLCTGFQFTGTGFQFTGYGNYVVWTWSKSVHCILWYNKCSAVFGTLTD